MASKKNPPKTNELRTHAFTFRCTEEEQQAIKKGLADLGLPEGFAIVQLLLAAFGEKRLALAMERAREKALALREAAE